MAQDTKAVAEADELDEFVEWIEDGNRRRGSRYGSAYKEYVLKWLAAEADYKAIIGHPDAQASEPAQVEVATAHVELAAPFPSAPEGDDSGTVVAEADATSESESSLRRRRR